MKKIIIFSVVLVSLISIFFIVKPGESITQSYYSGDAISYQNNVYIVTTNTGSLEIFKLADKELVPLTKIRPYNSLFNSYGKFFDAKFSTEDDHLYVYAVSNYTIYKYEIIGTNFELVKKTTNSFWEWHNRVDKIGDKLITISAKGVKVYNTDLESIVAYDFKNINAPYNISGNDQFLLSVDEEESALLIYDINKDSIITQIPLNFKFEKGNRRAYQDLNNNIYVVDDYQAKKFDLNGKLLGSFTHLDYQGFDMAASGLTNHVYFSNGVGVVKLNSEMGLEDYAWTGNLGGYAGWAMGLKVVYNQGDKIIIFNNSNILVLDDKLDKIASLTATAEAEIYPLESLFLNLNHNMATVDSEVLVSGGGFLPQEEVNLSFNNASLKNIATDYRGRFSTKIKVPNVANGVYDIKVTGNDSELSYSISFQVR
ncbi:hypothetical protein GX917_00745 [Candidatus Falkowbacteria bacterium]|nr:hypothetical protein [Candidatus Falkowbacteria bacterium]